jgi:hypothetical protein
MPTNESHGTFEEVLAQASPNLQPVCQALKMAIAALHPQYTEVAWPRLGIASYGIGPKKMTEHYAYIAVQSSHVNLGFYRGAQFKDPDRLLQGTGKGLRHVKLHRASEADSPALIALLVEAIKERQEGTASEA